MIVYINSCVRHSSRTARLARALLKNLKDDVVELKLEDEHLFPLSEETVDFRNHCIEEGRMNDPVFFFAKQFAAADTIVISAPFWDYSFPALLKIYIENICVPGITFEYNDQGIPTGCCKAGKLYYVTTSGGPHFPEYGYNYVKALAQMQFGIPETELICAENLDLVDVDPDQIMEDAIRSLEDRFKKE